MAAGAGVHFGRPSDGFTALHSAAAWRQRDDHLSRIERREGRCRQQERRVGRGHGQWPKTADPTVPGNCRATANARLKEQPQVRFVLGKSGPDGEIINEQASMNFQVSSESYSDSRHREIRMKPENSLMLVH